MKRVRGRIILVIVPILVCLMALSPARPVMATTPSNVDISYVYETSTLLVEIMHATTNMETHYIARIEVRVNSVLNQSRDYTSQPNLVGLSDSFSVPAVIGDVISATAICSVSGQLTDTITLTGPVVFTTTTTTTTTTSSGTPSGIDPMLLIVLGSAVVVVVIVIVMMKRK
jgi:hypothetical protein